MKKVAVIDYGSGNLHSIISACKKIDLNAIVTDCNNVIMSSSGIILPGVGAFADAMNKIRYKKLDVIIKQFVKTGKPLMGICLGMQLLFDESYEQQKTKGLGLVAGDVCSLNKLDNNLNIGWYKIIFSKKNKILNNISNNSKMYFVHSYICNPEDKKVVLTRTKANDVYFCSSINYKNLYGFQFHPEKSSDMGLHIYSNYKTICKIN
jgi:glutamine amidotransferase